MEPLLPPSSPPPSLFLMKGGILEVLLVSARGIGHTNLLGTPTYYVIIQCGTQVQRSKISSGKDENVRWNEKLTFEFPLPEWENLTHLKFRIMDEELFTEGGFVGETIVYLGGIISEGTEKGLIELFPAPYNVVLEDDTYKGEIKIGFKFIASKEVHRETIEYVAEKKKPKQSICRGIVNLWKFACWRFLFFHNQTNSKKKEKQI